MHRGKCLEVPVTPEGLFESSEIGEQEMSAQGIHHVTLIVDDREQASRFYGDVLGMEEKSRGSYTPNEESLPDRTCREVWREPQAVWIIPGSALSVGQSSVVSSVCTCLAGTQAALALFELVGLRSNDHKAITVSGEPFCHL